MLPRIAHEADDHALVERRRDYADGEGDQAEEDVPREDCRDDGDDQVSNDLWDLDAVFPGRFWP